MEEAATIPKRSEARCNAIKFSELCSLFEKLSKAKGMANKLKMLFSKGLKEHLQGDSIYPLMRLLLPANDTERGKYGLKQAMIASTYVAALHLDKASEDARRLINWKDPNKSGVELSKITTGDFGMILEDVLKSRVRSLPTTKTIGEVNALLDQLANAVSNDDKGIILRQQILDQFNALEQKWLIRIIFQDLKIGLRHENVLGYFYPTAVKRYNECTNLRIVCEEEGVTSELTGVQLFVPFSPMLAKGFPFSSQGQVTTVETAMKSHPFVMDLKLDGERILCHIGEDNSFVLYTRRGNDYTEHYWPVTHNIITSIRKRGKFSCIIDGEICALDAATKTFLPFGNNLGVAKVEREFGQDRQEEVDWYTQLPSWMTFVAFDILFIDGADSQPIISSAMEECGLVGRVVQGGEVCNLPLAVRRKILEKILVVEQHRVEIVPHRMVRATDVTERKASLESYFNEITLQGQEGLVIKDLLSPYELGEKSRAFSHWVKMKPEYGDQTEDLDLLILGGYYGEGQSVRGEGISTFLCGIKTTSLTATGSAVQYHTLCKVGTGYSFQQLQELRNKLAPLAISWDADSEHGPYHLQHWHIAKRDDRPHVYYPPEQSIVLQLKCAELVESTSFSAGYTCRFPRVQRIRYDKSYVDILSLEDVVALRNRPRQTTQQVTLEEGGEGGLERGTKRIGYGGGRRKNAAVSADVKAILAANGITSSTESTPLQTSKKRGGNVVDDHFKIKRSKPNEPSISLGIEHDVEDMTSLFSGATYCVIDGDFQMGDKKYTRNELVDLIRTHGGDVVANPSFPNCLVIAPAIGAPLHPTMTLIRKVKKTIQLQNLLEQAERDIIDFRYVLRCIQARHALPLRPCDYISYAQSTRHALLAAHEVDLYGDSYHRDVTVDELQEILLTRWDERWEHVQKRLQDSSAASAAGTTKGRAGKAGTTTTKAVAARYKKAVVAMAASPELVALDEKQLEEMAVCWADDHQALQELSSWRSLAIHALSNLEERFPLYAQICNALFSDPLTIVYVDLFADLGHLVEPKRPTGSSILMDWQRDVLPLIDPALQSALSSRARTRLLTGMRTAVQRLQLYGALVTSHLHSGVTHVLVADEVLELHHSSSASTTGGSEQQSAASSSARAAVAMPGTAAAATQHFQQRWQVLQDRLRRLRLLDAQDFPSATNNPTNNDHLLVNKEKRLISVSWVERSIERQRQLIAAETTH